MLLQLEDLGFCAKGRGGQFVAAGNIISGIGKLAVNTDGGGLCNNHPANRGGIAKVIEVVRQLRGEALPAVQVKDCKLALVQHQPPRRSFKPYVRRWTGPVAFAHEAHSPQNT